MNSFPCRLFTVAAACWLPLAGADKKLEPVRALNEAVELVAGVHVAREEVKALVGAEVAFDLIVVQIKVRPRGDAVPNLTRDAFTIISRRDGQKTAAMHPSQIAGSSSLMVSSTGPSAGGGIVGGQRGPIWGGIPGTSDRPRRIGGDDEGVIGSSTPGQTETKMGNKEGAENPLLAALRARELPQGKLAEPAEGLLYFLLEGKHKLKDLELLYKGPGGNLVVDFQK